MVRKSDTIHAIQSKREQISQRHTRSNLLVHLWKNQALTDSLQAMSLHYIHYIKSFGFPTHTLRLSFRLKSVQANRAAKRNVYGGLNAICFKTYKIVYSQPCKRSAGSYTWHAREEKLRLTSVGA
jgi:hypothetical protein